jgi:hypothetical protein
VVAACSALGPEQLPPSPSIDTAADLVRALQEAGAQATPSQGALAADLGGVGSVWRVSGAEIQVYEYGSPQAREMVSKRLDPAAAMPEGLPGRGRPNLWATGRLIVVYAGSDGGLILLLSGLLGDPLTAPSAVVDEPYPPAVLAAMQTLAEQLGREPAEIQVVMYQEADWPDGCLGLAAEGESCTQALTPGWHVILAVDGAEVELRTDLYGGQVRSR